MVKFQSQEEIERAIIFSQKVQLSTLPSVPYDAKHITRLNSLAQWFGSPPSHSYASPSFYSTSGSSQPVCSVKSATQSSLSMFASSLVPSSPIALSANLYPIDGTAWLEEADFAEIRSL